MLKASGKPASAAALAAACAIFVCSALPWRHAYARQNSAPAQADGAWHTFGSAGGSQPKQDPAPQDANRPATLRVQTNLVNILASVMDADGKPVAHLTQDAFALAEEGV